jgi:hypothetical protein
MNLGTLGHLIGYCVGEGVYVSTEYTYRLARRLEKVSSYLLSSKEKARSMPRP